MISGVNIIGGKASIASANGAGGLRDASRDVRRWVSQRKFLGSKRHVDLLKTDLNAVEIITVQNYKHTKNKCAWTYAHTLLKITGKHVIELSFFILS